MRNGIWEKCVYLNNHKMYFNDINSMRNDAMKMWKIEKGYENYYGDESNSECT